MVDDPNKNQANAEAQRAAQEKEARMKDELQNRTEMKGEDPTGQRAKHADDPRAPRPSYPTDRRANVPKEGFRHNPENISQELPPERQAPRPVDPAQIGTGANKAPATAPVSNTHPGFGRPEDGPTGPSGR